jgi:hypothetical protein
MAPASSSSKDAGEGPSATSTPTDTRTSARFESITPGNDQESTPDSAIRRSRPPAITTTNDDNYGMGQRDTSAE